MSPAGLSSSDSNYRIWHVNSLGYLGNPYAAHSDCVRPLINLTASTQTSSGDGTKENPFVVE